MFQLLNHLNRKSLFCKYKSSSFHSHSKLIYLKNLDLTIKIHLILARDQDRCTIYLNATLKFISHNIFSCRQALLALPHETNEYTKDFNRSKEYHLNSTKKRIIFLQHLDLLL